MANLFGIDIAGIVNTSIAGAGGVRPGQLTRSTPGTRTPGDLTGGTNPTTQTLPFQGFVTRKVNRQRGTAVGNPYAEVSILGASISIVPEVNDVIVMDGRRYTLVELLSVDPALALYVFRGEG